MLNVGRLGAGRDAYYLDAVASGAEDYYTGAGEAPGTWIGGGCAALDLDGQVDADQLRAVLAGVDPRAGERLGRTAHRRVPGFDLTFRPPKSVSVLYGLAASAVSAEVKGAHDAAVHAAVGYLEAEAARSRRGTDGYERVAVEGFVAAAFVHRTSRAGDPLLHTHVVVANTVRTVDDQVWRTLDSRALYRHAKTAGYLYQAHLRHELTRRLGLAWQPVVHGYADLDGIPRSVLDGFSRRRREIQAALDARGEASARAAQVATLATRPAKDRTLGGPSLRGRWAARAHDLGYDPASLEQVLGRRAMPVLDRAAVVPVAQRMEGPEGLTAAASTFDRRDVLRGFAEQLPAGTATAADVVGLTDAFLDPQRSSIVRLLNPSQPDTTVRADRTTTRASVEPRWSTPELLALEQRVLRDVHAARDIALAQATPADIAAALARHPSLSDEQRAMVERLSSTRGWVDVVVGKAGTGKTYALSAAHTAWHASGIRVHGCALAARAATELRDGAGIPSTTIASLLADLDRHGAPHVLGPKAVLVVDEAGMVGTRTLARLLDHAAATAARVVLIGDPHQLPELQAGGLYAALARQLPAIELHDNRRQTYAWERDALDELRTGDPADAVEAYAEHGRLHTAPDAETVRAQLVADWWAAHRAGAQAVMVALRRSDVDDLNTRARTHAARASLLTGPAIEAGGRTFQAGDAVLCWRNDRALDVTNGTRGTVFFVDPKQRTVTIGVADGTTVMLPAAYLDAGHLDHGYAITGHKVQGATVDRAYVLGSDLLYREWGYVALSRAREGTHLYTVAADLADATRTLAADLADSRAQQLASASQPARAPRSAVLEARAAQLEPVFEHARRDAAAAERQLDDLHGEREALGPLRRLAGADRRLETLILEATSELDDARARMAAVQDEVRKFLREQREVERTAEQHPPARVERRGPEPRERSLDDDFGLAL